MRLILVSAALIATALSGPSAAADVPAPGTGPIPAGSYTLDKPHASLIFRVNHAGFSHWTARFTSFDARLQFDPAKPAADQVTVTIDPASITPDNPPPGFVAALQGAQWLNAGQFPQITFKSTRAESVGKDRLRITGELTLHGTTQPVVLDATFNGGYIGHPMDPHARIGFSAHGTLKRSQFGIAYGIPQPGSTMGVSDAVEFIIEAEFSGPAWKDAPAAQPADKAAS
ncbi:MAG TPA: YceI family protein [Steroidobacteraceae bacterium]|nr:YceI family protein [Steroidobacteraceae bacterium]